MTRTAVRRWVTVFNGARDGYQLALALWEADRLEALVTDAYVPFDNGTIRALTQAAPRRVRETLARRYCAGLPSHLVRAHWRDAVRQKIWPSSLPEVDARLGRAAGQLARARGAGIFSYNFYAHSAFQELAAAEGARYLFQSQAHPSSVQSVLSQELAGADDEDARRALEAEPEFLGRSERHAQLAHEPLMADQCVVPSSYAGRTLVENGVAADAVTVVPYGVNLDTFHPHGRASRERTFTVVFVGQLLRRKGLGYLLQAWTDLALPDAQLLLVGHGMEDPTLLARLPANVRIEHVRSRARMREVYASADVCCLPSLTDSFGLVLLESLACGTPVIGTPNTGAPDLVTEGRDGFIVPIRDAQSLAERIQWCHSNREALYDMRSAARRRAEEFTWARFRRGIAAVVHAPPVSVAAH